MGFCIFNDTLYKIIYVSYQVIFGNTEVFGPLCNFIYFNFMNYLIRYKYLNYYSHNAACIGWKTCVDVQMSFQLLISTMPEDFSWWVFTNVNVEVGVQFV